MTAKNQDNYADGLFIEQYKILAHSYEELQGKRSSINNMLIVMYSSLIGLYNFFDKTKLSSFKAVFSIYSLAIFISVVWIAIIVKYMFTEKIKYKMIHEMESKMPVRIFSKDSQDSYIANSKIFSTSSIEILLPIMLLVLFSVDLYFNFHG